MTRQSAVTNDRSVQRLLSTVVQGGYCVGCGTCAAVEGSPLRMYWNVEGRLEPRVADPASAESTAPLAAVCPFSDAANDEDTLSLQLFDADLATGRYVGKYESCWAGHVVESEFRLEGSSGGLGTWLPMELLRTGMVDAVVNVHSSPTGDGRLFQFAISRSLEDLRSRAKSAYYPVEMSEVLREIRRTPGRYAVVALPCFTKAVRLLAREDQKVRERVRFCIGLVCGHLKSSKYGDFLAWQAGVKPGTLRRIDFRVKVPNTKASLYANAFEGLDVEGRDVNRVVDSHTMWGASWAYALFMYEACNFCDDVVGETADASIGDAWLRGFVDEWQGNNLLVLRNRELSRLVSAAVHEGRLKLSPITDEDVGAAQSGCYRQRREGLAYRLFLRDQAGRWRPPKRIAAEFRHLSSRLRRKYALRGEFPRLSQDLFRRAVAAGDFEVLRQGMLPLMREYASADRPRWRRVASAVKQLGLLIVRRVRG